MNIYHDTPTFSNATAVALGNFDGIHLGHTKLINALTSTPYHSVVYTFFPHPLNALFGEGTVKLINTMEEKCAIMEELGVDSMVLAPFDKVRDLTPSEFVKEILVDKLSAKIVICGFNFRFGKDNTGNAQTLGSLLSEYGVDLCVIDEVVLDSETVSSSSIRGALAQGDIERANRLIGRPFFVLSDVVHGKEIGRRMGIPTVNEAFSPNRSPLPYGVYFGRAVLPDGVAYPSVVNIGLRPTVNSTDTTPAIEAHLIDFSGDLYGEKVKIELFKKSRDEIKFSSVEELKERIKKDISECKKYFEGVI